MICVERSIDSIEIFPRKDRSIEKSFYRNGRSIEIFPLKAPLQDLDIFAPKVPLQDLDIFTDSMRGRQIDKKGPTEDLEIFRRRKDRLKGHLKISRYFYSSKRPPFGLVCGKIRFAQSYQAHQSSIKILVGVGVGIGAWVKCLGYRIESLIYRIEHVLKTYFSLHISWHPLVFYADTERKLRYITYRYRID